jgi:phage/plasmid-like protein (TIGR03299 family)
MDGHFLKNSRKGESIMPHNLNVTDGGPSMMYVGETPWHSLGTKLDRPATAEEAIQAAHLDFTVEKYRLKTTPNDLQVESHFATVRTDTMEVLGVVGSRYEPIQNKDAFTTFDALVGEGEAIYHTAGALGKGEQIWLLAKLPDYIRINGNDLVEKYLLLVNSHDGSSTVRVKLTPIRVVCENTLSLALSGAEQEVHVRHTLNAKEKLKEAHEILGLTNKLYSELDAIFNRMSERQVEQQALSDYVKAIFPDNPASTDHSWVKKVHDTIFDLADSGEGAKMAKGTLWGAYNAVTEYVDHYRNPKGDETQRLKSMWFGSGERIKKNAFRAAVAVMDHGQLVRTGTYG